MNNMFIDKVAFNPAWIDKKYSRLENILRVILSAIFGDDLVEDNEKQSLCRSISFVIRDRLPEAVNKWGDSLTKVTTLYQDSRYNLCLSKRCNSAGEE